MGKPAHFVIVGGGTAGWIAAFVLQKDPKLRRFAQETVDGLVREYRAAAGQALGHAEFLRIVRGMG